METWAQNLMDELEYTLNHLDGSNMAEPERYVGRDEMQEALDKKYEELRALIIRRTKGA